MRITKESRKPLFQLKLFFLTPFSALFIHPLFLLFVIRFILIQIESTHDLNFDDIMVFYLPTILSTIITVLSLIYILRYPPLDQINKFDPYNFILNYFAMKYVFPIHSIVFITLLILHYFNDDWKLISENYLPLMYLYMPYLFVCVFVSSQFFGSVIFDKKYLFALSKVYCLRAKTAKTELYRIQSIINSVKYYNIFLQKQVNVFFNIKNYKFIKYLEKDTNQYDFLNGLLESYSKGNNKNERVLDPMKYIMKEFENNLSEKTIKEKRVRLTSFFVMITTIVASVVTIIRNLFW